MDFSKYKDSYDENILKQWKNKEIELDVAGVINLLYGFTFTHDYAKGKIEDALSMDYWQENSLIYQRMVSNYANLHNFSDPEPINMPAGDVDAAIAEYFRAKNSADYDVSTTQELLLMQAIDSTGDGKTPETALCVIDVGQEYEYLKRKHPFNLLIMSRQTLRDGIDCLHFEDNMFGIEHIYFDMRRRFEVGYTRKTSHQFL